MSEKSLKRRNKQLKEQLDRERQARIDHVAKVTETVNKWQTQFREQLDKYAALQARYDELLFKYLEVSGEGDGIIVSQEDEVPDEEGREVGPAQAVEEEQAGA